MIEISAANNYLITFDYDCLNLLTLKDLRIKNNNLNSTDLQVFAPFVNLTYLSIGNNDNWIQENQGNQFTGSFASLQELTKLKNLHICNLLLQPEFQYLPSSLQMIICNDQILKELTIYGHNIIAWQAYHPHLMKQANKAIFHLTNQQLAMKKQILVLPSWFKGRENQQTSFNYLSRFNYSSFLVKDIHNFSWELNTPENKVFWERNNSLENKFSGEINNFSEIKISENKSLPLRLCNLSDYKIKHSNSLSNNTNYLALSYCWGTKWEKDSYYYGQPYQTRLTKLGRKAINKVISVHKLLKRQNNNFPDYIWIDNFCINQTDPIEKGKEVANQRDYYSNATATLVALAAKIGNEIYRNDEVSLIKHIITKIFHSPWSTRAWTFQEGILSKQTIFMFDDYLVDGRRLALHWGGGSGAYNSKPCIFITPFGWSVGSQNEKTTHLNLGEALFSITHRDQTVLLDKIYSILGLLSYGNKIDVEYKNNRNYTKADLENKLTELIDQAYLYDPKEIISYLGERNSNNWWLPIVNENGYFQIEGALNYDNRAEQHYLTQIKQITKQGIQLKGHWIKKTSQQIIEIDCLDKKKNSWPSTLQFILNLKTKVITIKQIWEKGFYYSKTQRPTELFIDLINYKVIAGESKIKEYLQKLELQSQSWEINNYQIES